MAGARTPGPQGHEPAHSHSHAKPHRHHARTRPGLAAPGPTGTPPPRIRSVAPEAPHLSPYPASDLASASEDLGLLTDAFHSGMLASNPKIVFARYRAKPETFLTEAYLRARDAYFGSTEEYRDCVDAGRKELDANKRRLRAKVEPNAKLRHSCPRWQDAQDVFYAWVRRGYEKKLGPDVNIPALIIAGDSERLRSVLKQVSLRSGHEFKQGTFNPRPEKNPHGYRLGTISDHAFGTAIDVDAPHNPQISADVWASIVAYTDAPAALRDGGRRTIQWRSTPKDLYDAISDMSQEFSTRIKQALQEQASSGASTDKEAISALRKQDRNLGKIPADKLAAWKEGFFAHSWEVVEAMHEAQMRWGATFTTVDLHHFELLPPGESQ